MQALMYPLYGDPVDFSNIYSLVPDMRIIAHSLAAQNRWHGNTRHYWSVANHCVHAVEIFRKGFEFFGVKEYSPAYYYTMLRLLLHDAGEAYTGDINTYIKHASQEVNDICDAVQYRVENYLLASVVGTRFLIEETEAAHAVHLIDKLCGWAEVHTLANEECPLYNFVEDQVPPKLLDDALMLVWGLSTELNSPVSSELRYTCAFDSLSRLAAYDPEHEE